MKGRFHLCPRWPSCPDISSASLFQLSQAPFPPLFASLGCTCQPIKAHQGLTSPVPDPQLPRLHEKETLSYRLSPAKMLIEVASTCLLATVALATSEPDPEPVAHFLANGTWAHPDIAPSYFSGHSPMAPVPVVASGLASTYLPQQHPQHPQYVQPQQQYLPQQHQYLPQQQQQYLPQQQQYLPQQQQQQQYVDRLLVQQPQVLDRRLTGATLSYENGMYGTRLTLPHSDHAATAGGIYTSSGMPVGQGSLYPAQTHAGTLIQGHYTSPVIAARVPQGQVVRNPLQALVGQNYPVGGRRVNPIYTTASQVDRQALVAPGGYLNQPICTNILGAPVACY